jgi:hypothetical protein
MNKSVILDANLAVLLVVGLVRPDQVGVHKRTRAFDQQDFTALIEIVGASGGLIFTPNVLTEVSNLLRQTNDPLRGQLNAFLASKLLPTSTEQLIESSLGVRRKEFVRLGLTDAVLLHLSATTGNTVLLTTDLDLYLAASGDGLDCINFNHLRERAG